MRALLRVARTPLGAVAVSLLVLVLATAIFAPMIWGERAEAVDTANLLAGPSSAHPIGTDGLGRDMLARVLVATRLSVGLALLATLIAGVVGIAVGVAPFLLGPRLGRVAIWFVGIAVAFPGLLLALFFAVVFGQGWYGAVLAIGLAGAPAFARLCQTLVASVAERDFVAAARVGGVGRLRIMGRHILPNIGEPLIVSLTISAGASLLAFAGLSFLGLGVQAPLFDWGRLMDEGLGRIYTNPLAALAPGLAVVIAGLAFNLTGEAAARALGIQSVGVWSRQHRVRPARRLPVAEDAPAESLVLDVRNLKVSFPGADGPVSPVRGVSVTLREGEAVGIVGESGSGKSLTALSIAQLVEEPGRIEADRLHFLGEDLRASGPASRRLLGTSLAMVFQDPMTSFNPTKRIGAQLAEVASEHLRLSRGEAMDRAVDRLGAVGLPDPERHKRQYPHELSGGMRQRALIGMGLMATPRLIIADEPTTALDVTVQQRVLRLLDTIRQDDQVALLFISHDLSVVAELCDRVLVMYAGRIVEDLPAADLAAHARHPYTRALLAAVPDLHTDRDRPLATIPGRPVDPANVPQGCAYAARCPLADEQCRTVEPRLEDDVDGNRVACWNADAARTNLPLAEVRS